MSYQQWHYGSALLAMTLLALNMDASAAGARQYPKLYQWVERPWEVRYVLWVNDIGSIRNASKVARDLDSPEKQAKSPTLYRQYKALFAPTIVLQVAGTEPVAAVVISFERTGRVVTPNASAFSLTAKRNVMNDLVLVTSDSMDEPPYYLADWFEGIRGDDMAFSPAVCVLEDIHRYERDWRADRISGNFGCREWTYQLYNRDRPYIDVTSYQLGGTFIKEFVGWSRFTDPPKPVIGKEGTTWLCLHECPGGASPGIIPDIKAWTRKHGFPMPVPPHKQPMFPNADFEAFQDD